MDTIDSNPEAHGCKLLFSYDAGAAYEFDTLLILLRRADNKIVIAEDSGCSCPIPFENVRAEDLKEATKENIREWFGRYDSRTSIADEEKAIRCLDAIGHWGPVS